MKKGFLKCIAVVMVVIMTAVYIPMTDVSDMFSVEASAATYNGKLGGNVTWSYDTSNNSLNIAGSGNMSDYTSTPGDFTKSLGTFGVHGKISEKAKTIVIGNGVTNISNNVFKNLKGVTSVTIPASVTSIGASAFEGCSALTTVNFPASVKSIGNNAFKNTKAANITIPASVTSIAKNAFDGISGLKITCDYGSAAHDFCKANSKAYKLSANTLVADVSLDTAAKQVTVALKIAYSPAKINAGNFTFTYNDAVTPVVNDTVYNDSVPGVASAVVHNGKGKISVAVMAQEHIPYTSNASECVYTFAELKFNINGQADKAEFSFTPDVLMINNAKGSVKSTTASLDLHVYSSEKVEKEATCKQEGTKVGECIVCGKTIESKIPVDANNHAGETKVENKKDATCKETGYTGDTICKDCGAVITAGSNIPVKAHEYNSVVTEATCKDGGYTTYTCKVCGDSYVADKTPAADHKYDEVVTAATCTEAGYTTYTCSVCEHSYKGAFTQALGHDFDANGECTRCDEVTTVSVTFTDDTGISVDNETKIIIIRRTLKVEELKANIDSGNWIVTDAQGNAVEDSKAIATGYNLKAENSELSYTIVILGDVNSDGKVNSADARTVLRVSSRLDTATELMTLAGDCDGKAKITAADARLVLRVASKLEKF